MTDITSEGSSKHVAASGHSAAPAAADGRPSALVDLIAYIELFYFAYRDFTCDPDAILSQYGFGRAHHRVLHFVHRNPGLKVAELLEILKITKQSLARVLKQLVDEGFIIQKAGNEDRRERRLYLSAKGTRLNDKLTQIQAKRIEGALANLGPGADAVARNFLFGMITEKDRPQVETLIKGQRTDPSETAPDCNP
ncbi:MarR family winged helix-turn-helix transcriptional regulator [Hyphomicrobium sp. 99]|uniref:MarR family winged helix-turn-helix transcriptional regulator n=1 Tax=Hyphomicrobium sp. 99 TaxID=1163419 RepID=UPI0009E3E18F|nr:MarR family transcriptional regulator [Hyphomicrobium sp. 99]